MSSPSLNLVALPRDTALIYPESQGAPVALMMRPEWLDALTAIINALEGASTITGTAYFALTPADNVVPTLESVIWDGTLAITLDRAVTTIDPATLNGAYPSDGHRFSIALLTDGADGREVVWDAAYLGAAGFPIDGTPNTRSVFSFITLPGSAGFLLACPPILGVS